MFAIIFGLAHFPEAIKQISSPVILDYEIKLKYEDYLNL